MNLKLKNTIGFATLILLLNLFVGTVQAQSSEKSKNAGSHSKTQKVEKQTITVADGKFTFEVPKSWKKNESRFGFIEADYQLPKTEGDQSDGRLTISVVAGGVERNFQRWIGQFKSLDQTDEKAFKEFEKQISGTKVDLLRIQGTYLDGRPVGPKTEKSNYVLYGAAIKASAGNHIYIKAYGPFKTMEHHHKALKEMLDGMQVKK